METILIFIVFALAVVAIVALGRPVSGKLDSTGAEIHAYVDGCNEASKKSPCRLSHGSVVPDPLLVKTDKEGRG